jgi:hypothetical protein
MAESVINSYFPSQVVSDVEKISYDYGLKVAKAIEREWFDKKDGRYRSFNNSFHQLRLYARGEQSVQKYKDELAINGDLSYLNLDWKPVPIISKFVDILVNGMSERVYDVSAVSQDPAGVSKRTEYMTQIVADMQAKRFDTFARENLGMDLRMSGLDVLPGSQEELDIHMQLTYKQGIEIASEQAINTLLEGNKFDLIRRRYYYDLGVLGIAAVKTGFNTSEGVVIDYVDPADLVYSHTDSPYFDDIYYVGEVKSIPVNELIKQFPHLTEESLKEIQNTSGAQSFRNTPFSTTRGDSDKNKVDVLYFNYKTYMNEVYKIKKTGTGGDKAIQKNDSFNPPNELTGEYGRTSKAVEVLYDGAIILGTDKLLKWEMAKNMMRPKSDYTKVKMNYSIVAPRMYNGKIDSIVSRITGFADMIQLTHLKLQQVMSRMVPDGVYLDADGLAEIDLGNGTNYNPQEALNMFFQTGSVIGRSFTSEGDMNPGKVPIQEISSGSGGNKMQALIGTYNYYLQMIRDVTGMNEARDGSTPSKDALVGIQKMAAANSNTATRHVLQSGLFLAAEVCEALSLRISDILEYSPTRDAFVQAIGLHNVASLGEIKDLHLYDFGIFLKLSPDDEEKAMLENNIAAAISQQTLDIEDAIDIREIPNIKLANRLLKLRRKKKMAKDQQMKNESIQQQSQANQQAQAAAAQGEMQKAEHKSNLDVTLAQQKSEIKAAEMRLEVQLKRELMDHEFALNKQLKELELKVVSNKDTEKEDRKDERTKIQATQQSALIDQRKSGSAPKNFESAGNDVIDGDFDLGMFDPK